MDPARQPRLSRSVVGLLALLCVLPRHMCVGDEMTHSSRSAEWTRTRRLRGYPSPVTGAVFLDRRRVLTAGEDGRLSEWRADAPGDSIRDLQAHDTPVRFLAYAPGGYRVASATPGEVKLWHTSPLRLAQAIDPTEELRPPTPTSIRPTPLEYEPIPPRTFGVAVSAVAVSSHTPLMAFAVRGSENAVVIWDASARVRAGLAHIGESVADALAFTNRGSLLAAGLRDGRVLVWDVRRAASATKPGRLRQMAVPPTRDGESPDDHHLRMLRLNAAVSTTLRREIAAHDAPVSALAFTPKGAVLVTAADDTAAAWDVESGEKLQTFRGHTGAVTSVAVHRGGVRVITGSEDGTARLWEMATGEHVRSYRGHDAAVRAVAVDRSLLTASDDGSARLWRPGTGREEGALHGHVTPAELRAISGSGHRALTWSRGGGTTLWDTESGRRVWRPLSPESPWPRTAALSSDGRFVAMQQRMDTPGEAPADVIVRVWNTLRGAEPIGSFYPPGRTAATLRFVDQDTQLLVIPRLYLWPELRSVRNLGEAAPVVPRNLRDSAADSGYYPMVSGDGASMLCHNGVTALVFDVKNGCVRAKWDFEPQPSYPTLLNYDGTRAISYLTADGRPWGRVCLWDTDTGEMFSAIAAETMGPTAAAFSHDGRMLVTAANAGHATTLWSVSDIQKSARGVTLWSARTGEEIRRLTTRDDHVTHVEFSGDNRRVVVAAGDSVHVYEVASGDEMALLGPYDSAVAKASISHDGATVVVMTDKGVLDVWRAATSAADGQDEPESANARDGGAPR